MVTPVVPDLPLKKKTDGWWITGMPEPDCPECGPYDTKAEAESDQRGLKRYYKFGHIHSRWTSDR